MTVTIDDALTAISAALSARASAGEGGRKLIGWAKAASDGQPALHTATESVEQRDAWVSNGWAAVPLYTAAPQPAQAGASGGGDERVRDALDYLASIPGTEPYLRPIREALATPQPAAASEWVLVERSDLEDFRAWASNVLAAAPAHIAATPQPE